MTGSHVKPPSRLLPLLIFVVATIGLPILFCGRYAINIDCPLEQHRIEKGKFLMDAIRNPIDFNGLALPMDNLG